MKVPLFSASSSSSIFRKVRLSPYLFTLLAFIVFVTVLYGEDLVCIFSQQLEPAATSDQLVVKTGESTQPTSPSQFNFPTNNSGFTYLGFFCFWA